MSLCSLQETFKKYKISPKKYFGQNFILDAHVIHKIATSCITKPEDIIIEIGPGIGSLTRALLQKNVQYVYAIEKDRDLMPILQEIKQEYPTKFYFFIEDACSFSYENFVNQQNIHHGNIIIVGNLPYNVGQKILQNLCTNVDYIDTMYLMFQDEVSTRICADCHNKSYGRMSILCQNLFHVEKILSLPPEAFTPPPKIYSSIVKLQKKEKATEVPQYYLEQITQIAFQHRRKMLKKNMAKMDHGMSFLKELNIAPDVRAENVTPSQYLELAILLKQYYDKATHE